MPRIVLYGTRLSPFVEKVWRGLRHKGLDFTFETPNPIALRKLNPVTGKMPVATFDGETLHDSSFILRRADKLQPEPRLFSSDPEEAAEQRRLEDWADESLYWYLMALRCSQRNVKATLGQILGIVPAPLRPLAGFMIRRQLKGMCHAQGLGRLPYEEALRELGVLLEDLGTSLGSKPFFHGSNPGIADFAVHGQLNTLLSGPTPDAEPLVVPPLRDFKKRVEEATGG
jgi:glutathione S-transferase